MSQTDDDLDRAILSDFLLGRLSGADEEQARLRLEADARWQALAAEIEPDDALVRSVRQASDTPRPADPAPLRELIGHLERLREPAPETADFVASPDTATPAPSPVGSAFLRPSEEADELGRLGGFRIIRPLGAGGMGLVFEADDPHLQRRVALKVMNPGLASEPRHRQRFLREARAAAALRHDHVIDIYQVGEDHGVPFFAMPLLDGESLEARLGRDGPLSIPDVLRLGREIADGLAAAHAAGLIHRDIKPANIWLESKNEPQSGASVVGSPRIKLLDFGLARAVEGDDGLTLFGAVVGTPGYISPEQADGAEADARSDLFGLGCVLYRMTTGKEPFPGATKSARLRAVRTHQPPPAHQVNAGVPLPLSELIQQLLAKDPADRPASARDVVQALRCLETGDTVLEPTGTAASRSRWRWLAVGVAAALLIGLAALFLQRLLKPRTGDDDTPALPAYTGNVDVVVWRTINDESERLPLSHDQALPLHPGDQFRIEVAVEPAAYVYLFWIDTEGEVSPMYPWNPPTAKGGGGWGTRPAQEQPCGRLSLPPRERKGYTIPAGKEGMLTLLLLARSDPLPLDDTELRNLFAGLPPQRPVQDPRSAVWFENGRVVKHDDRRKRQWFEETDINDPVLRLQELLRDRLQPYAAFTAAVSFAKQGK
jgi:serine/threonine protein kinase